MKKNNKKQPDPIQPPVFPDPVPYVSLSLGYQFVKGDDNKGEFDNYEYMLLSPEQKSRVDFALVQELGKAFTFADRVSWIELLDSSETGFYSQESIMRIINEQLRYLAVPGMEGHRAWVGSQKNATDPAIDPEPHGQAIYLIIPPREHRTVYNYPIHLTPNSEDNASPETSVWRLEVKVNVPGVKPIWNPCVCASFSAGVNIPENAMTPQDRLACRMDSFFQETSEVIEEIAEKLGVSTPDDFGDPTGMQNPHAFDQFKSDFEEMRSRMNARGRF